jgi:hypothetical protein
MIQYSNGYAFSVFGPARQHRQQWRLCTANRHAALSGGSNREHTEIQLNIRRTLATSKLIRANDSPALLVVALFELGF